MEVRYRLEPGLIKPVIDKMLNYRLTFDFNNKKSFSYTLVEALVLLISHM